MIYSAPDPARFSLPDATPQQNDPGRSRRVELILQQLDSLPTLSAIAVRVIELTTAEDSRVEQVVELISADPSLASRVLKLARCAQCARGEAITTVHRAVLHLGFDAVRSAVLSVQIFDFFDDLSREDRSAAKDGEAPAFDREIFWHHSLAVAVLSERLAEEARGQRPSAEALWPRPGEAFLAGLLHDLGLLALHVLLPQSLDRVCRYAEAHGSSLDHTCARIIGTGPHLAGKRLAERWLLPRMYGDVMWLHGQRSEALPALPHRRLVEVVSLADVIARARYLAPVGHGTPARAEAIDGAAAAIGVSPETIDRAVDALPADVSGRAAALGMDAPTDRDLLLRAVGRANLSLGRINQVMRHKADLAQRQSETLAAIARFQQALAPGDSTLTILEKVVQSAAGVVGGAFFAMLIQPAAEEPWQLLLYNREGQLLRSDMVTPPAGMGAIADLADHMQLSMEALSLLPWLTDYLSDAQDLRSVRLLPLRSAWGVAAVLLHEGGSGLPASGSQSSALGSGPRPTAESRQPLSHLQLEALTGTWAAAIAAGRQHQGATALGEQLAEANRMLIEAQEELTRRQALSAVGEIAAGAAHEMNNPLTVISGRAQQLASTLADPVQSQAAQQIIIQSHRLSDMISALRCFAEPVRPRRQSTDLGRLITRVAGLFQPPPGRAYTISTVLGESLPPVLVDPEQMIQVLTELVRNAVESKGARHIELRVQTEPLDDRLRIQVRDDGAGLSEHALAHAFDPFFSEKAAGRQPGLGLSTARRYVEAHGGRLTLENGPNGGAIATVWLDQCSAPARDQSRQVA